MAAGVGCADAFATDCHKLAHALVDDAILLERFTGGSVLPAGKPDLRLSEAREGGARVAAFTTLSGARLVYKPRSAQLDQAYTDVLALLSRPSAMLPGGIEVSGVDVLDAGTRSYARAIEAHACGDTDGVRVAWRRAGRLLAMLFRLGTSDAHRRNIMFCGESPVLIDIETLVQPSLAAVPAGSSGEQLPLSADSPLETGMLGPNGRWLRGQLREGGIIGLVSPDAGTPLGELPTLDGTALGCHAFAGDVEQGFLEGMQHIDEHAEALLAPGGPVETIGRMSVRINARSTMVYKGLLSRLDAAGRDRSAAVQWTADRLAEWPAFGLHGATSELVASEVASLARGYVPHLTIPATARTVGYGFPDNLFAESAIERAQRRLRGATASGNWYARFVRRCVELSGARHPWEAFAGAALNGGDIALRGALADCADLFMKYTFEDPTGRLMWLGFGASESGEVVGPRIAGPEPSESALLLVHCLRRAGAALGRPDLERVAAAFLDQLLHPRFGRPVPPEVATCLMRGDWGMVETWLCSEDDPTPDSLENRRTPALHEVFAQRAGGTPFFDPTAPTGDLAIFDALCCAVVNGQEPAA